MCSLAIECVLLRERVVYWYSFGNPRTKCIHCDNCLVVKLICHIIIHICHIIIHTHIGTQCMIWRIIVITQIQYVNSTDKVLCHIIIHICHIIIGSRDEGEQVETYVP